VSFARGITLVELMIAMAIGVGMIAAAVSLYAKGRAAYRVNESLARVQEQARFALAVIEPDIEMAGHYGFTNDPSTISLPEVPASLQSCGALDVATPVQGANGVFALPCAAYQSGAVAGADTLTVRRVDTREARPEENRLQIYATRFTALTSQRLFVDGVTPGVVDANHRVHNLLVRTYYIARDSVGRRGFPALRVKSLARGGFDEDEVMSGVEDLQVQFGVDSDGILGESDGSVNMYVDPDNPVLAEAGVRVQSVRLWLLVRADNIELGFEDDARYRYANVDYAIDERPDLPQGYRRLLVTKTIELRNL
jgi:type IV pilus assembly protein PilW